MSEIASSAEELHSYWREPGVENETQTYLAGGIARSLFLVKMMDTQATHRSSILEIGCNAGRNLAFLYHSGYTLVQGIEISQLAVDNLRRTLPELKNVPVTVSSIEDSIKDIPDRAFDVVFTMAVLEHVPIESEWIFPEIGRIGRKIITIEDEKTSSGRHFPRDYGDVFTALGLTQIAISTKVPGLPRDFRYRVFETDRWLGQTSDNLKSTSG